MAWTGIGCCNILWLQFILQYIKTNYCVVQEWSASKFIWFWLAPIAQWLKKSTDCQNSHFLSRTLHHKIHREHCVSFVTWRQHATLKSTTFTAWLLYRLISPVNEIQQWKWYPVALHINLISVLQSCYTEMRSLSNHSPLHVVCVRILFCLVQNLLLTSCRFVSKCTVQH